MNTLSAIGKNNGIKMSEDEILRLKSEADEARTLRKKLKRMESEIEHLSKCLQEAKTEAEA